MSKMFAWNTERPYNAYSNYMKKMFGGRVQKLTIDGGFTCPNRDGRLSYNGCTFCNNNAFNPSYCRRYDTITQQIIEGQKFHAFRYKKSCKYLAYFQAYSNTYDSLENLKSKYEQALAFDNIIGLVIGTRPDCVDNEKLDYLQSLSEKYYVVVEYGIESCYDKTLLRVNRGHNFDCTVRAIEETKQRGLHVGGHLIFGLPGETKEEMIGEAEIISSLPIDLIKFHQLQILDNTTMKDDYLNHKTEYNFFSFNEYVDFIIHFVERLNPNIVIERFASEVPPRYNIGPSWGKIRNEQIVQHIENELINRNTYQGKYYNL